jgi:hypothetical protein
MNLAGNYQVSFRNELKPSKSISVDETAEISDREAPGSNPGPPTKRWVQFVRSARLMTNAADLLQLRVAQHVCPDRVE